MRISIEDGQTFRSSSFTFMSLSIIEHLVREENRSNVNRFIDCWCEFIVAEAVGCMSVRSSVEKMKIPIADESIRPCHARARARAREREWGWDCERKGNHLPGPFGVGLSVRRIIFIFFFFELWSFDNSNLIKNAIWNWSDSSTHTHTCRLEMIRVSPPHQHV